MSVVIEWSWEEESGRSMACLSISKQMFLIVEATPERRTWEECSVKGVSFVRGRMES